MGRGSYVVVVTGLPRSGTSMMMQMLEAGGIPALTDRVRKPDEDNPGGYYEFEPVKRTKQDPSWVAGAPGKAVKLVYRLLRDLPADTHYRAVFMRRELSEIHASQDEMLRRSGQQTGAMDLASFERLFTREIAGILDWLAAQPNFEVLQVHYNELLGDPPAAVAALDAFLGGTLDTGAMLQVVDPSLYRQRRAGP